MVVLFHWLKIKDSRMSNFQAFYYQKVSGKMPVKEFVDSLQSKSQEKFFFALHLLEEFGPGLPEPHSKNVGHGISELRFSGQEGCLRVIYFFFEGNKVILTNGFIKKTNYLRERRHLLSQEEKII